MKRVIRQATAAESFSIKVDIYFAEIADDVVATDISDIIDRNGHIDQNALVDYNTFIQNVLETLDYYGFQIIRSKESKSFPNTSKYAWIAYAGEVDVEDVPLMVKMRISDHVQTLSLEHRAKIKQADKAEADELKLPRTKKRQRFITSDIVVNNQRFDSYEEALAAVDKMIYQWLDRLDVDVSDITPLWR